MSLPPSTPAHGSRPDVLRKRSSLIHSHHPVPGSGSGHTPLGRSSAMAMSPLFSPSSTGLYRSDDDTLVFEFGARFLRAGFGGEPHPRAQIGFGPDEQRRVGDFRQYLPGFQPSPIEAYALGGDVDGDAGDDAADRDSEIGGKRSRPKKGVHWGAFHELWREDLRSVDLGLVECQLERALRTIDQTYLMVDLHPKKLVALFPSNLPRQLMSTSIAMLFERFHQVSAITIVPQPFATALAAGVRTAVVVDIGWESTRAVVVEEFRAVREASSVRAGKMVVKRMVEMLGLEASAMLAHQPDEPTPTVSLEDAEEVLVRMGWCRRAPRSVTGVQPEDSLVEIELPSVSDSPVPISFHRLADPVEESLFDEAPDWRTMDDHERPIHVLVYDVLRQVGIDTRTVAMGRIVVTGGMANVLGVKGRLKHELERLVSERGWATNTTRGMETENSVCDGKGHSFPVQPDPSPDGDDIIQVADPTTTIADTESDGAASFVSAADPTGDVGIASATDNPSQAPPESDPIPSAAAAVDDDDDTDLSRSTAAPAAEVGAPPKPMTKTIRLIESCGSWAGASMLSPLHLKGVHEVDRAAFEDGGLVYALSVHAAAAAVGKSGTTAATAAAGGGGAGAGGEGRGPGGDGKRDGHVQGMATPGRKVGAGGHRTVSGTAMGSGAGLAGVDQSAILAALTL